MSPLETTGRSLLQKIRNLRRIDEGAARARWIFLARDVFAFVLLERWLARCRQTQWEDADVYERMIVLIEGVSKILQDGPDKLVAALYVACKNPAQPDIIFSSPAAAEGKDLDPRLAYLGSLLAAESELAIKYARSSDAALVFAATLYLSSRQYVLAQRALKTPWNNRRSQDDALSLIKLALEQADRRASLSEQLKRALSIRSASSGTLSLKSQADSKITPFSQIDGVQSPDTDIFEAISAAYAGMEAAGELGDPEMPDLERSEGAIEWYDSWDKDVFGPGDDEDSPGDFEPERPFGDPRQYENGEDYQPLPEKGQEP